MSDLHTVADDYLVLRRAMGFELKRTPGLLHGFIDYMEANHAAVITTELAMDWATLPSQASSWWSRQRLGVCVASPAIATGSTRPTPCPRRG